jgi:NADH-quinone oxidoreductase subunit N
LCSIGAVGLLSEIFDFKKYILPLIIAGLLAALGFVIYDWDTNVPLFNTMMYMDNFSLAFTGILIVLTLLWFIVAPSHITNNDHRVDYYSLIIFALTGAMLMVSYSNLIMLFLGLEILSVSMYILAGSNKTSLASNEAAFKYFLMGAFATGFLLFGITLIYGQTGSFNLAKITESIAQNTGNHKMLDAGVLLIMIAILFKVSAAPFHFWVPDVYQGSPTLVTIYMATVVKTAAFAAFLKLFITVFAGLSNVWTSSLWIICAATILIGNITAVFQNNIKRMLAYSSISHAGYMLLAILALNDSSSGSLLFYTIAYSISSIASFTILILVNKSLGSENLDSFNGMYKKNPLLAFATIIAMLSLAGIPPAAGFFAKYYIFTSAIQSGFTELVLIAILGSLIGVFYYFRIIIALFKESDSISIDMNGYDKIIIIFTSLATLILGIFPGLLSKLI